MTVRHLFQSKELMTILNRSAHSENYSFIVELKTAIANQLEKRFSLITNEKVKITPSPVLFHSDFDNFNQWINDVKGAGSTHTAHGIMLQEVKSTNSPPILEDMSPVDCTKGRPIHLSINSGLPEYFLSKRKQPVKNQMAKINGIEDCHRMFMNLHTAKQSGSCLQVLT